MKILGVFLLAITFSFGGINTTVTKVVTQEDEKTVIEIDEEEAIVGMSAIVIRVLESDDEIVGYRCDVVGKKEDIATLNCIKHNGFFQEAMPKIQFEIKEEDKVILSPLGKRAILLAPTHNIYLKTRKILQQEKGFEFVSSDLLAAPLFSSSNPFPNKEEFTMMCDRYLLGSIVFGFKSKTSIVDCQTFKVVEEIENNYEIKEKDIIKPFFHRLDKIEKGVFDWFTPEEIEDFDSYYKGILDVK
ncbi:MAG: plasminogen-binding N-terminal domain-containing protein [Campylobacterales bacterium]|nr:plasminogen-binding N-terminal domain-containing protein [Campylobacterales bacterium]